MQKQKYQKIGTTTVSQKRHASTCFNYPPTLLSRLAGANREHTIEPCCAAECGKTTGVWRCSETNDLGPPWPRAAASHSLGEDEADTRFGIQLVVLRHDPWPHGEHQHNCKWWNIPAQRSTKRSKLAYYSCITSRLFRQNNHHPPTQLPTHTMQNKISKTKSTLQLIQWQSQ